MSRINYPPASPYAATPQTSWYIGNYVHRPFPPVSTDRPLIIDAKYENRPDLLSNDLYGKPDYYYVFFLRNRNVIKDVIWGLKTGLQIMYPTLETIKKVTNS